MKMPKTLLTFILLLLSPIVSAQFGKLYSADMELSNSLINQVYLDRNNIIWIATEDGLNRYDGSKFTIYKHDELNGNSPLHNYVKSFFEDSKGNFYIGYFNGLQTYDDAAGIFREIPLYLQTGDKFSAHVIKMLERRNGTILIGTSGHGLFELARVDGELIGNQLFPEKPSRGILDMYEDGNNDLWISTSDKGLIRINKNNEYTFFFGGGKNPQDIISSICHDDQGNIFAGSMNSGLYKLDNASGAFRHIPYSGKGDLTIKTLYFSKENKILIGTDGNGMKTYDPVTNRITDENFNLTTFDFSKSKVHSIIEDNSGNIWLGIFQKGVMMLPSRSGGFGYIGYKSVVSNIIGSNCVMSVYEDHEGTIWVGTDSDGIYGVSADGKQSRHFAHSGAPNSVPSTVMCIYEDSRRNLWVGSYLHGLAKMNRRTGECEYVKGILDDNDFPMQRIYSIVEDDYDNLWIGTMGGGLFYMNLNTGQVVNYYKKTKAAYNTEYLFNNWINCILKTKSDRLYIATYDGLGCVDLKTKEPVPFSRHLLARNVIYTLYEDDKGMIWMGTSLGLYSYDPQTEIMVNYTTYDGLPSNTVCAIKGDGEGFLWISTNYGISRFNPTDRSFTNFYSSDGLQGNEFSKNAVFAAPGGRIMFGGLNGITFFKPENIAAPEKELKIRLTDFYINDQVVKKGMKSGRYLITDSSATETKKFHLDHFDNSFTLEFSTMEFSNPERITYSYSINGGNWVKLSPGTNRISFNKLAPGKYQVKVMAMDYNIRSGIETIGVQVSPAWYASAWAKLLYVLVFLLIVFQIIMHIRQRYKARQKMMEHIHAKEINEAKLQFFINVSHEIRTPMSLVMSPLKRLMATDKDGERQKAYFTMNRNIDRVLNLINQLLDVKKIDKGQLELKFQQVEMVELLEDIQSYFEEQAQAKNIELLFRPETERIDAWIDSQSFDKVIINVLSNAFKFTPEKGKITLDLREVMDETGSGASRNYIEIVISDSGIGISKDEVERIFERFYQAENTTVKQNRGTGIGLHLARSIMELHHGTITAQANPDGNGSSFIIRLPAGKAHLAPESIDMGPAADFWDRHTEAPPVIGPETDDIKTKSKSKRYVMVVDDDKDIREYIIGELSADYHMIECANGKEALATIQKKAPDLVISDVVMPEMDGITLCQKIKQNIHINHVPVVLLTAKSAEEDNIEGLETGADAYIVKPFNIDVLKKTVQNIIKNREMLRNTFSGSQQQKDKVQNISIKSADDKLMERIMRVINKNIDNPELNVEMVAKEVGISRVHLHRKLKELTNQSTRDLIRNIRLQQAANLLSSKRISVSEVAIATGFNNVTHFSTVFKETYGMSPMAYMEENLNQENKDRE